MLPVQPAPLCLVMRCARKEKEGRNESEFGGWNAVAPGEMREAEGLISEFGLRPVGAYAPEGMGKSKS